MVQMAVAKGSCGPGGQGLKLDLAGREGGLLHGNGAVAAQNRHLLLLLLLQRLLVPVVHGHGVKGRDQGHLRERRGWANERAIPQWTTGRPPVVLTCCWGQLVLASSRVSRTLLKVALFSPSSPLIT